MESSANLKLSLAEIRAPFDGIIDRIPNKVGSLINEGDLLTSISDNRQVYAYFNVSEREYLDFTMAKDKKKGDEAHLILANDRLHEHVGIVESIDGKIDKNTGSITFRAKFPNPDGLLKHGSSGKVRLQKELKAAMIIPQKSTFEIQDKTYVFMVDADNVVRMRSINPIIRLPDSYVINSGLSASNRILYEGIQLVRDGDKIIPELVHVNGRPIQFANQ
jgi:RND family efflux transporter MFP subunit